MDFLRRLRGGDGAHPGDRLLIRQMKNLGQQLDTLERETTHYLYFGTQLAADKAASAAEAADFQTVTIAPGDGVEAWSVRAVHTIPVSEARITEARRILTAIANDAGGEYDGWDTDSDEAVAERRKN